MSTKSHTSQLWDLIGSVADPEIPVLSIADLGVLRDITVEDDGHVVVTITPTYSGCPAMDAIRSDILARLDRGGEGDAEVRTVLAPAWTTDWMSQAGRDKLAAYGIAPPRRCGTSGESLVQLGVCCPQCGSFSTRQISRFGSTACKAHYVCNDCHEPFDHFKEI